MGVVGGKPKIIFGGAQPNTAKKMVAQGGGSPRPSFEDFSFFDVFRLNMVCNVKCLGVRKGGGCAGAFFRVHPHGFGFGFAGATKVHPFCQKNGKMGHRGQWARFSINPIFLNFGPCSMPRWPLDFP